MTDRRTSVKNIKEEHLSRAPVTKLSDVLPDEGERDLFLQWCRDAHDMRTVDWLSTAINNGTITDLITDYRQHRRSLHAVNSSAYWEDDPDLQCRCKACRKMAQSYEINWS